MSIEERERRIAVSAWAVAVGMVEAREPNVTLRELAADALRRPSPSTIRALVAAGRGQPWLPSVIDALAQVGIAGAEDVLGGAHAER